MPRGDRTQKLQPRSMDAQINRWEPTMESIMKDMREDAISYPERVNHGFYSKASTPGGMENYFLPRGDVVEVEKGIGPMWQRFLDRFRGPDGFEFGLPKYNSGGIAGLPGQWTPSMSESEEEEYNIRPLQLDPGIMSIEDLEDLFEEVGLDKRLIYNLINSGGLSQLVS